MLADQPFSPSILTLLNIVLSYSKFPSAAIGHVVSTLLKSFRLKVTNTFWSVIALDASGVIFTVKEPLAALTAEAIEIININIIVLTINFKFTFFICFLL